MPNTISGEGQLPVELKFNKLEDFSPAAIANQVDSLRRLLEMREKIASLLTYMDGKVEAERLVSNLLQDPRQLAALAAQNQDADDNQGGDAQ